MISDDYVAPITVIIPSFMRRESLLDVIGDLAKQSQKPNQVFVIDASPDECRIQQSEILGELNVTLLKYIGIPNASAQRNLAIAHVKTPWILFLDDDVRFDADLLETYIGLVDNLNVDGISGLIKLPKHEKYYAVKKYKDRLRNVHAENYQGYENIVETHVVCTANFLVRTIAVREIGGFDENISGTIDDVDLALRLRKRGYRIIHHPLPEVLHLQIRNSGARFFEHSWALTNLFYFQYRHFENPQSMSLLLNTLWHYCRPSRDWFHPALILRRAQSIFEAHYKSLKRLERAPKLMTSSE
jgi:GT2 family glycosyltransferase